MAVVVEPTIPFPPSSLDLESAGRWNSLLPLIRPSVQQIQTTKGQHILVDVAHAGSKYVHLVAIGRLGNFSSKLLDDRHVTAIVTERSGAGLLTAEDLPHVLQNAGIEIGQGVVVVRAGSIRQIHQHGPDVIEVESAGELEQDHILHLLGNATGTCRASIHHMAELLKAFVKSASSSHLTFHTEKAEGNPAVLHAEGAAGFQSARHAVERGLQHAMKAQTVYEERITYSVCYSDVNGLSRLENYIIAGEIAKHLDSKEIPYTLCHSTILNHRELARGWSVSICPVPAHYLLPQTKPEPHRTKPGRDDFEDQQLRHSTAQMAFSDAEVRRRIEAGCDAVIKAEPTITEYDTVVGDGDCGYTLRDGAKQVLSFIADRDLAQLPAAVSDLVRELEINMGGTSGALYCIYLTALAASLASEANIPDALLKALDQLCQYTRARIGDRTMMDALIPFVETLASTHGNARLAVQKAREGVEGTKTMEAKLGRSSYLDDGATRGVPDPGAYGLLVLLEGMSTVAWESLTGKM